MKGAHKDSKANESKGISACFLRNRASAIGAALEVRTSASARHYRMLIGRRMESKDRRALIERDTRKLCGLGLLLFLWISTVRAQTAPTPGFQDTAHWARIFESAERGKWQKPDQVVTSLNLKQGQTVVDIGAGSGYFTRRFAHAVGLSGKAIGLDIEPGMIDYMNADAKKLKLPDYEARLVRPDDPELAPKSADVIFFCDVLHHIDDRAAYLKKLKPALKSGGRVAVIDFKKTAPFGPPAGMRIRRETMVAQFRSAGFRVLREYQFLPYQYFFEFEPA
jgi:arsenite methyltransferase